MTFENGEALAFERLLVDISARFVGLAIDEIDHQIELSLRVLGEYLQVDRSSFAEFTPNKRDMVVTHCYVAPGIPPFPPTIVEGQLPWYAEQIRRGEPLRFVRLPDDAPPEAVSEREYCRREGLKSNLAIPLAAGDDLRCVITFATFREYRQWPESLVERLWLVGQVFANALARKRTEEHLHRLQEQMTRLSRVTLVGELAAAIAHEINQPLCAIISNAQAGARMLSSQDNCLNGAGVHEIRETLDDIAADSRRAHEVVTRVRTMLQRHEADLQPTRLADIVQEVLMLIRGPLMQSKVKIVSEIPHNLPSVMADSIQLQQVVLNVALNAIDAMADVDEAKRRLSISATRNDVGEVSLTIADTGPGVEPSQSELIFDAFYSTKPDGIGIGLAISRSIVEAHGGRMGVRQASGGGAEFHLELPTAKDNE